MREPISRRGFLALSARAFPVSLASLVLAACARGSRGHTHPSVHNGPIGPGLQGVDNVLENVEGERLFPGGIAQLGGSQLYAVYQHTPPNASPYIRGRLLADLGATAETEEDIFDGVSIDPSVATLATGETVILIHNSGIDWLTTRLPGPKFTTPVAIGAAGESMMSNVNGRVFVAFAQASATNPFSIPIFCREVLSATTAGPAFDTGARAGAAESGGSSAQKRASIGGIGRSDLLLAWDQPQTSQGGYRSVWVARSSDGGRTWFGHRKVADTGRDLRNPFVLGVSDVETRVYYVQGGTQPLGEVRTRDGGGTWSAPKAVLIPPTIVGAPRPSFFQTGGTIYCFTSLGSGGNALSIFRVP